jgi:acetyl esterase/lipase
MTRRLTLICAAVLAAASLSACSPLGVVNAISPDGDSSASTALRYGDDPRNMLDIYHPKGDGGRAPVIVFFYGGNWVSGKRSDYAFVGRALAARGFVVVVPDYRLYPQVHYPDFLNDAAAAVAWTERHIAGHGGDPAKVFVMGHSAGAYNAAMVALDGRWLGQQGIQPGSLRGWIGLAGPYDFLPVENRTTRPVFDYPNTRPESQPVNHADAKAPPTLLIAANKDDLVDPARNTGGLAAKLRTAGVPVRELYYGRVNHYTLVASLSSSLHGLAPTLDAVQAFVDDTVSGKFGGKSDGKFGAKVAAELSGTGNDRRTSDPAR